MPFACFFPLRFLNFSFDDLLDDDDPLLDEAVGPTKVFVTESQFAMVFASGVGVLTVLLVIPSGIGGLMFQARDMALRWVAKRRGLIVPSLLADVKPTEAEEAGVLAQADVVDVPETVRKDSA